MNSVDNTNLPSETVYPPCTRCGYLSLYQADNDPGYEPPNDIHLLFVRLNFKAISWQNVARSANACSLFRYLRLESLISLEKSMMDWHLIQGGVAIHLVTSHFRIQINLDEIDHYAWVETLSFTILFLLSDSSMGKKNPLKFAPLSQSMDW